MSLSKQHDALREHNEHRCRRLLARSALLQHDDLDWDAAGAIELDDGALRCLVYMRDVEGFVDRELAGMAGHPTTLGDPLIRDFVDVWRDEEGEHARALGRFLDAYADQRGVAVPTVQAPPPADPSALERLLVTVTRPVGHVVAATHMAWGATNELLTMNGYRLLRDRTANPVLRELLTRIAAQESRHYAFYVLQVEWRLAASRIARTLVRQLLRVAWTPVGVGGDFKAPEDFAGVATYLGSDDAGRQATRRMDRTIGELPGMTGIDLYARAFAA